MNTVAGRLIAVALLLNYAVGCTTLSVVNSPREVLDSGMADSAREIQTRELRAIYLASGDSVVYDGSGGRFRPHAMGRDSVFVGNSATGELVVTPLNDVVSVSEWRRELNTRATVWAIAGMTAFAVLVAVWPDNWRLDFDREFHPDPIDLDW